MQTQLVPPAVEEPKYTCFRAFCCRAGVVKPAWIFSHQYAALCRCRADLCAFGNKGAQHFMAASTR